MLRNRTISQNVTLIEALQKMDRLGKKLLIVIDNDNFVGLLSAGDIQRAIIHGVTLDTKISDILRLNIRIAKPGDSLETVKQMMFDYRMELCPVVSEKNEIINVFFWEDIFEGHKLEPKNKFNLPVVIMAGGLGARLRPLTNVLPKPLIPIGDKTIIEHIFDKFNAHGCNSFFISVNYKADLIRYYLRNVKLPYNFEFFQEDNPLGTAGSLSLLKGRIESTFFVSNCDILIEQDYSEILNYHNESKNEITVVAALKNYSIPYGTLETGENGRLTELAEKPSFLFKINSGMYILEPQLLEEIPESTFLHITQLISKLVTENRRVGVFPVSEGSWKDIGDNHYLKSLFI